MTQKLDCETLARVLQSLADDQDVLIGVRGGQWVIRTIPRVAHPEFAWRYGVGRTLGEAVDALAGWQQ